MIGKVTRGGDPAGLMRYLLGPSRDDEADRNPHADGRVIGSWRGDVDTRLHDVSERTALGRTMDRLAREFDGPGKNWDKRVWHCSLRSAPGDQLLSDGEWSEIAEGLVDELGLDGCRWTAVRHADDHIHVAAVLVEPGGKKVHPKRDWPRVHAYCRTVENDYGLARVEPPDRTGRPGGTRADDRIAAELGLGQPVKAELRDRVTAAAAVADGRQAFGEHLARAGVDVKWRTDDRGRATGVSFNLRGHDSSTGPVFFGGGKLGPHLTAGSLDRQWRAQVAWSEATTTKALMQQATAVRAGADVAPLASLASNVTAVVAKAVPGPAGKLLRLALRAGDRARTQPGGWSAPSGVGPVGGPGVGGPSTQLLGALSTAWQAVGQSHEREGRATQAAAASAAAAATARHVQRRRREVRANERENERDSGRGR